MPERVHCRSEIVETQLFAEILVAIHYGGVNGNAETVSNAVVLGEVGGDRRRCRHRRWA